MECAGNTQAVVVTNQDKAVVLLKFANGDVYELAPATLHSDTAVPVPTTSYLCVDKSAGDMTLQYTSGDGCVHRIFPVKAWSRARVGDESKFVYTVPTWSFGDPKGVCQGRGLNNNSANVVNANSDVDDVDVNVQDEGFVAWLWPATCTESTAVPLPWGTVLVVAGVVGLLAVLASLMLHRRGGPAPVTPVRRYS